MSADDPELDPERIQVWLREQGTPPPEERVRRLRLVLLAVRDLGRYVEHLIAREEADEQRARN